MTMIVEGEIILNFGAKYNKQGKPAKNPTHETMYKKGLKMAK